MKLLLYLLTSLHGTKRTFLVALNDVRFRGQNGHGYFPAPGVAVGAASLPTLPSHFGNSSSKFDASQSYLSPRFGIPH
jgi:hypothetical protein